MQGALLRGAYLNETRLRGTHLEEAYLHVAHLKEANMESAHLEGAYLRKAYLVGTDLRDAFFNSATNLEREAIIFSITSFHGRGFLPGPFTLRSPVTAFAAIEAVIGLFIEKGFIATFTQ